MRSAMCVIWEERGDVVRDGPNNHKALQYPRPDSRLGPIQRRSSSGKLAEDFDLHGFFVYLLHLPDPVIWMGNESTKHLCCFEGCAYLVKRV